MNRGTLSLDGRLSLESREQFLDFLVLPTPLCAGALLQNYRTQFRCAYLERA